MVEIVKLNEEIEKDTFIYKLKYESYFDENLFLELLIGILQQGCSNCSSEEKKQFVSIVFNFYAYITVCIISHFRKNDLFVIKNYTDDIISYSDIFRDIIKHIIEDDIDKLKEYINQITE
ncbi:hypothetical protein JSO59_002480 [Riemerella anatipestifer]|uniref:hypothetical protein n=1 Tax=Riemerella anatipestifer TaxID=34085 RepID=UPI0030BDCBD2